MKKALSLLLALALTLALLPASALAYSQAYGAEVWLRDTAIHSGAVLSDNIYWSDYYSQLRQEHFITFAPSAQLTVAASYGQSVSQLTTLSDAAAAYEAKGLRVVGAINGDFYDTGSGYPLGLLVSGGELLSGSANYYAAGFCADGSVVMGKPQLAITAQRRFQETVDLVAINKPRVEQGGMTLLTYDFRTDHTTGTSTQGTTAICTLSSGKAAIGGTLALRVSEVVESSESFTLQPNQAALTVAATGSSEAREFLSTLRVGEEVRVSFTAAEGWEKVTEAVGALYQLVDNGQPLSGFPSGYAPRSAIGVKADGQVVFYTVDGRQTGYSMGASMKVLAQRLAELGCVTALCLDGGGSTALAASIPDSRSACVVSSPSDGKERKVSNHLLLLAPGYATGIASHIYLSAPAQAILPGGTMELTANLVDTAYQPMRNPVMLSASAGEIVDNTFIAPAEPGPVTITATAAGRSAQVQVYVVGEADEMKLLWDGKSLEDGAEVTLFPGDKAELTASVVYNRLTLDTASGDYAWTVDPALGSYDTQTGVLTTNFKEAEGTVSVTLGQKTIAVKVILDADSPFADTDGHWGGAYMASLYHKGILTGVQQGEELMALPNKGVTRAEFAVLLARYLGIITSDYAEVEVPFTDMDKVGAWAQDAVRAMYALEIVGGIQQPDGSVTFDPAGSLSRAQAVTMLGRAMEESVPADLREFSDADKIPAYARAHFETLVALGVVGGSYGKLDPAGVMTRAAICKVLTVMPK